MPCNNFEILGTSVELLQGSLSSSLQGELHVTVNGTCSLLQSAVKTYLTKYMKAYRLATNFTIKFFLWKQYNMTNNTRPSKIEWWTPYIL